MNKRVSLLAGTLTCAVLLAGCDAANVDAGNSILKLPECSGTDTVFAAIDLESMASVYRSTVSRVVDAHIGGLTAISSMPLECTAGDYRSLMKPTPELADLANQLPEWGPSRPVSEADLGSVLLEYQRVYECALLQRGQFLPVFITREQGETVVLPDDTTMQTITVGKLTKEKAREEDIIERELAITRPTLDRLLAFLGSIDRLRPLSAELECLKRASLDLRNVMGLAAEAASCMPKTWDARGSLRDLAPL